MIILSLLCAEAWFQTCLAIFICKTLNLNALLEPSIESYFVFTISSNLGPSLLLLKLILTSLFNLMDIGFTSVNDNFEN